MRSVGSFPWQQRIDIFVEVPVGEPREVSLHVGIGFDAVHLAGADQAGEECDAAVQSWAADWVLGEVRVYIDVAIFKEKQEAVVAFQHVDHSLAKDRFVRDSGSLSLDPVEELIDQRAREFLPNGATLVRVVASDGIFNLEQCGDAQERHVQHGRTLLGLVLDQLASTTGSEEG